MREIEEMKKRGETYGSDDFEASVAIYDRTFSRFEIIIVFISVGFS